MYQLLAPGLTAEFPALRSLDALPNNLPRMRTAFVGREKELADIAALLERHQCVTIVGAGGIGKTRASLQIAANLLDGSGDGVWFVELAPLSSGDFIATTLAKVLDFTLEQGGDPLEQLVRRLKTKRALLVFDNCEHVVEAAARAIAAILAGCPNIRVVASSRQSLGIAGEAIYRMPPLVLPDRAAAGVLRAVDLARYPAIALFAERATAASNAFELDDDNAATIAEICRRLDGIPLAIELAASRIKMLSPRQLRDRLDERFRMLTGGSRDVLPRQQTLRALIDWSYDLLDRRERMFFARLGIFTNGFTLEGATAVGRDEDFDEFEIFDVLASLVDKSLVLVESVGDTSRYRLLESTHAYALEKLAAAGEYELVAGRRLTYLRDHFEAVERRVETSARREELDAAFEVELEDVRAALDLALASDEIVRGSELLAAIGRWSRSGLESEGVARCESFLRVLCETELRTFARLARVLGSVLHELYATVASYETCLRAIAPARAYGDRSTLARVLVTYAAAACRFPRYDEGLVALAEVETIAELSPNTRIAALNARALLRLALGDEDESADLFERLRREHRLLGNSSDERIAAGNLAEVEHKRGRTPQAVEVVRSVLPGVRASGDTRYRLNLYGNLVAYLLALDDLEAATAATGEALGGDIASEYEGVDVAIVLEHAALAHAIRGSFSRAACIARYVEGVYERRGFFRQYTEVVSHDRLVALLAGGLAVAERDRARVEGAALSAEAAIALALDEQTARCGDDTSDL